MSDELRWKQFCDGLVLGLIGPFEWVNSNAGPNAVREYWDKDRLVAWMRVEGANTDRPGHENPRTYGIDDDIYAKVAHLPVYSDEEWEVIDFEFDGDVDAWRAAQ